MENISVQEVIVEETERLMDLSEGYNPKYAVTHAHYSSNTITQPPPGANLIGRASPAFTVVSRNV